MVKGWNHFIRNPIIVDAPYNFWRKYLYRNFDKMIKILLCLSDGTYCIICENHSKNFQTVSNLASHIKNHKYSVIDYWLEHIICISPNNLEDIMNRNSNGRKYRVVNF